jgi:hypothetical protein
MVGSCIYSPEGGRTELSEGVDIPARIAELRSVLLEVRSEDVQDAVRAAIEDCERRLDEAQDERSDHSPAPAV